MASLASNSETLPWKRTDDGLRLLVRATPGAKRAGIGGVVETAEGPALAVKITEAAAKGRANRAVIALLARALGAPKSAIGLRRGETARIKHFVIAGDVSALKKRLVALCAERGNAA